MTQQVLNGLNVKPGLNYIDCNEGEAGHTEAILNSVSPPPNVLGIDLDLSALNQAKKRLKNFQDNTLLINGNFKDIKDIASSNNLKKVHGILFDLGMSSFQIESKDRGFSFQTQSSLDMRYNSKQKLTASEIVNNYGEKKLADIIFSYGEERYSRRIARSIVNSRPLETTSDLVTAILKAVGTKSKFSRIHPATKTFQAIRIEVNNELESLKKGISDAIELLCQEGRLVVLSYHSLEDKIVKSIIKNESKDCVCPTTQIQCICDHNASLKLINRKVIKPTDEEVSLNPRSRSAKLRVAQKY